MPDADIIIIGSGLGGLVAGALLARYGKSVIICESHTIPGGAAHSFTRQGFQFDSGPSFFCGLSDRQSLNPLRHVLDVLDEAVPAIPYDPLGHYHFPEVTVPIHGDFAAYQAAIATVTPAGAAELGQLNQRMLTLYKALAEIPTLALRSDWHLLPQLLRYPSALAKLLPQLGAINGSFGDLLRPVVQDPWVRRLLDVECFLLSGLTAAETVAPEMAFMFGERANSVVDYPLGGSEAIVQALVRGLEKFGGHLRLGTHVDRIDIRDRQVAGVTLRNGDRLSAPIVISNATLWDTYNHLIDPADLPPSCQQQVQQVQPIPSFMHLHLGIRAAGLDNLTIHHVVIDAGDPTEPGQTCMISIPSVLDPQLAPAGYHNIHAYTLEPWSGWQRDAQYSDRKRQRAERLYRAIERVIPDVRSRVEVELIGTPLTHARFLRRHQGTYGPAIPAGQGLFPSCHTPIHGLYRVGDSTIPGIGVPAVAASGILCANTLIAPQDHRDLLNQWQNRKKITQIR